VQAVHFLVTRTLMMIFFSSLTSSVKTVNQLLAGVHIAAAAEAMALGARLGLNTRMLFDIIKHGGGHSW